MFLTVILAEATSMSGDLFMSSPHSSCTSIDRGSDGAGMSRKIRAAQTAALLNEKMQPT